MTEGVSLLTISKVDIVDAMEAYEVPQRAKEWIRKQDAVVIDACITQATRHFELGPYYYAALCDTLQELMEKYLTETGDTSD